MNMSPAVRPVTSVEDQWDDKRDVIPKYQYIYSGISYVILRWWMYKK